MSGTVTVENLRHTLSRLLAIAGVLSVAYLPVAAAQAQAPPQASNAATLFENVRIFDGRNATLSAPSRVLVRGNIIERISPAPIDVGGEANVHVISAGTLAESWRQQPGTPGYCTELTLNELKAALAAADRRRAPENREALIKEFAAAGAKLTDDEIVARNRAVTA